MLFTSLDGLLKANHLSLKELVFLYILICLSHYHVKVRMFVPCAFKILTEVCMFFQHSQNTTVVPKATVNCALPFL